jgi:hypothetical protein
MKEGTKEIVIKERRKQHRVKEGKKDIVIYDKNKIRYSEKLTIQVSEQTNNLGR